MVLKNAVAMRRKAFLAYPLCIREVRSKGEHRRVVGGNKCGVYSPNDRLYFIRYKSFSGIGKLVVSVMTEKRDCLTGVKVRY